MVQTREYAFAGRRSEDSSYDIDDLPELDTSLGPPAQQEEAALGDLFGPLLPLRVTARLKCLAAATARALPYTGSNPRRRSAYAHSCALPYLQDFQQTVALVGERLARSAAPEAPSELVAFVGLALQEARKLPLFDEPAHNAVRDATVLRLGQLLSRAVAAQRAWGETPDLGHLGNLLWWQSHFPGRGPFTPAITSRTPRK